MFRARHAIAHAVRTAVEPLEGRRLLAAVTGIQTDHGQKVSVQFDDAVSLPDSAYQVIDLKAEAARGLTGIAQSDSSVPLVVTPAAGNKVVLAPDLPGKSPVDRLLSNGLYEAAVRHGSVIDDGTNEKPFRFLRGDATGDGVVNFSDFVALQSGFGQSDMTYAQGDLDYSGTVDFADYVLLQSNFGMSLPNLPTVPGQVVVGNALEHTLLVSWAASATEPRDGFKVYRSSDGINFDLVNGDLLPTDRVWQDADPTLVDGQKYWSRVRAYTTADGASAATTKASAIVACPLSPPGDVTAVGIDAGKIALTWTPPPEAEPATYLIYRGLTGQFALTAANLVATVGGDVTSYTDAGLTAGGTYHYIIVATSPNGTPSAPTLPTAAPRGTRASRPSRRSPPPPSSMTRAAR